ncbi:hypothetical protein GQ54DRAFT_255139 [Martensiomyces pterosporus]|nr:hypothetical protein GQ54DRAFT_255139 [Martensiomyces pterosporus]
MFVPGYIFAPRLLHVGFTVALVGFVLVECLRVFGIGPWGGPIQDFIRKFTDHRDAGSMVTSHFYLLYGCALPVWLGGSSVVACLSGVLSLGVADAAASLVGMRFGRVRWPGTPKTVEGTAGFVLSLLAATEAVCLLSSSSRPSAASSVGWVEFLALSTISGVLEALTEQNDNLVIPLFMYTATHALVNAGGGVLGIVTLRSALFVAAALAMPHMLLARFTILKSLGISEPAHIL